MIHIINIYIEALNRRSVGTFLHTTFSLLFLCLSLFNVSCSAPQGEVPNPKPSAYYWKTTFTLDDRDKQWIKENKIEKMYLRLFDVTMQQGSAKPLATLQFNSPVPQDMEIIPTVFIEEKVMRSPDAKRLAPLILTRIKEMAAANNFSFHEVQMDCDWTATTQTAYYDFLRYLQRQDSSLIVSATIRLHQLSMEAPPVSYGALMLYNTGNFRDAKSNHNPILDTRDVMPYMQYLAKYPLPLCAAYPNFRWQLLFANEEFKGILYGEDLSDTTLYHKVSPIRYDVIASANISFSMGENSLHLFPGEHVKVWEVSTATIDSVKQLVQHERPNINKQIITYALGNF